MADKIPDRLRWAAATIAPGPADSILEIGCGHGVLLSLLSERLTTGTLTAIDRSDKMVAAARARNADDVASRKVSVEQAELASADFGDGRFDKIVAVNVNVFWLKRARELATVRRLVDAAGKLYLFFEPPSAEQAEPIAEKLATNLEANGFRVAHKAFTVLGKAKGVCVIADPA
ncbi:class I SAM-dependent methyltransferase [Rhizobiaceae sp. 2RAB30]